MKWGTSYNKPNAITQSSDSVVLACQTKAIPPYIMYPHVCYSFLLQNVYNTYFMTGISNIEIVISKR